MFIMDIDSKYHLTKNLKNKYYQKENKSGKGEQYAKSNN